MSLQRHHEHTGSLIQREAGEKVNIHLLLKKILFMCLKYKLVW